MHIIYLYQRMKEDSSFRIYPHTYIFGAKAAPSYYLAKKIIKLINSVAEKVNNDPETNKYLISRWYLELFKRRIQDYL